MATVYQVECNGDSIANETIGYGTTKECINPPEGWLKKLSIAWAFEKCLIAMWLQQIALLRSDGSNKVMSMLVYDSGEKFCVQIKHV